MPTAYEQFIDEYKTRPPEEEKYKDFVDKYKIETPVEKKQGDYEGFINTFATPQKKREMQKSPWIARHPTLYGIYGATKGVAEALGKVGHIKYADPYEIKKLMAMSPQEQKRQLLMDTLEDVTILAFGAAKPKTLKVPKQTQNIAKEVVEESTTPDAVKRIHSAIRKAKPLRKEQEKLYTLERRKRIAKAKAAGKGLKGEARAKAETAALRGEMPKKEFESLKIAQEDSDALFNLIKEKIPNFWEKTTADRGLWKIFDGAVPQESELVQLRKAFPQTFIKDLLKKRPLFKQMKELGYETINVPRAIMASFDFSAPLRQGIFLAPRHPVRFTQAFLKMFKQFGSEKAYRASQEALTQKKWYNLLQEEGLQITEIGGPLAAREEAFMGANLAEKIPLIGRGIRASNRAYTGFLNKLRVDVGNDLVEKAFKARLDPENNPVLTKAITKFVNAASGRGGLGPFEDAAIVLNSVFFSPRLMGSRLTLLNPIYYINPKTPAFVRKEALKSLFAFAGAVGTTLGLADMVPGVKVGKDPRSADFGKIQIGNTRIDIMGGFQQYIRAAGQLISGKYVSTTTGKEYTLGEGYKPLTRWGILGKQLESKLAPPASFAMALLKGQDIAGEKVSVSKEVGKRFVPMVIQDVYDIAKDDPDLLPLSVLGVFGVGLQTYEKRYRKSSGGIKGIGKL